MATIQENLEQVRERIAEAAQRAERDPAEITLVAVSKMKTAEIVNEVIRAGATVLGENKAQELCEKLPQLENRENLTLHFIGHLQTNKVKSVVDKVNMIQSVDSLHLLEEINRCCARRGRVMDVLVEINAGEDPNKFGLKPNELENFLKQAREYEYVKIQGLMGVAPLPSTPETARACFRRLHKLFVDTKGKKYDNVNMSILSMGMSADFEIAIEEGSNMVRVGQQIFGARI